MERSVPPFPFDFSTEPVTLLVVGSAPCLTADLDVAKGLRPSHLIMAINYTACWMPADFVFSIHTENMPIFADGQAKFNSEFTTHADIRRRYRGTADYLWRDTCYGATSSIAGASVGPKMGFQEVILCGAPMDSVGYYKPNTGTRKPDGSKSKIVRSHIDSMTRFASKTKGLVFSMSGLTRKNFGYPPEVPIYGN
jgi:hypothetical protein